MGLDGEALLAATGITPALRRGALRITREHLDQAEKLLRRVRRLLRRYLHTEEFADAPDELRPFDYDETLELLSQPMTESRAQENLAGIPVPELQDDYAAALGRAWGYLKRELPIQTRQTMVGLHNEEPPDLDVAEFRRAHAVADRPITVLENLLDGSLVGDEVQTLEEVFPELYRYAREQLLDLVYEHKLESPRWELSTPKEELLAVFLQSEGLDKRLLDDVQRVFAEQGGGPGGTPPSAKVPRDRLTTPTQALEQKGVDQG